jgi:secondary thiamine-phosphate synthase enzyme
MHWIQQDVTLEAKERGFHLVTREVMRAVDLSNIETGVAHFFLQHTSAAITLNENASPDVRGDFERHFRRMVPEDAHYEHTIEGPDDMPAHLKASLLGSGLSVPIRDGGLLLGTWQGLYLCEHRERGGPRTLVVTAFGQ